MQSHEGLIGARVRVLETDRRAELRGMFGTIEQRFGQADYVALDVRLDDGRLELFWPRGVESAEDGPARRVYPITAYGEDSLKLWAERLKECRRVMKSFFEAYRGRADRAPSEGGASSGSSEDS